MPLASGEEVIRDNIFAAPDLKIDKEWQLVTEPLATANGLNADWDSTVNFPMTDTSNIRIKDWIKLDSDGQRFEVEAINPNSDITISNPSGLIIPSGSGPTTREMYRAIIENHWSPTVEVGNTYKLEHTYIKGTDAPDWGACFDHPESIV